MFFYLLLHPYLQCCCNVFAVSLQNGFSVLQYYHIDYKEVAKAYLSLLYGS